MFVPEPSEIAVWSTTIVQTVLAGSGLVGVRVKELEGEELVVKLSGVPVGHSSVKALPVALTDLLKLIVIVELAFTSTAPFVGTVLVTVGGVSVVNENT
jgi:hypothetical protein